MRAISENWLVVVPWMCFRSTARTRRFGRRMPRTVSLMQMWMTPSYEGVNVKRPAASPDWYSCMLFRSVIFIVNARRGSSLRTGS